MAAKNIEPEAGTLLHKFLESTKLREGEDHLTNNIYSSVDNEDEITTDPQRYDSDEDEVDSTFNATKRVRIVGKRNAIRYARNMSSGRNTVQNIYYETDEQMLEQNSSDDRQQPQNVPCKGLCRCKPFKGTIQALNNQQ